MKKLFAIFSFLCLWFAAGVACQVEGEAHNVGSTYPTPEGDAGIPVIYHNHYAPTALAATAAGQILAWYDGGPYWGAGGQIFTPGGDISGSATSQIVVGIRSQPVATGTSGQGAIFYYGASGWTGLPADTAGKVLQTNGAGVDPSWATISGPPAGTGAVTVTGGVFNTPGVLSIANGGTGISSAGSSNTVLTSNGSAFSTAQITDAFIYSGANITGTKVAGATTAAVGVVELAGDLGGTSTSPSVVSVRGQPWAAGTAARGAVPYYGASGWTPRAAPSGAGTTNVISFDGTDPVWKVSTLLPTDLAIATISSQATGDILAYSSGAWNRVAGGTNGYALTTVSTSGPPAWTPVVDPSMNGFRLTLTTATPITTSNVSAAGTIYLTPWKSGYISLYTSSAWTPLISAEVSFAVSCTTNSIYDLLAYSASGTLTITQTSAWASATTRTDALAQQNGTWVLSSDHSRRWLGTYKCSATNQTEDSDSHRYVFNFENRTTRFLKANESTDSWAYTSATFRPANNASATASNSFQYVAGEAGVLVKASVHVIAQGSTTGILCSTGVGIDSTSTNSATVWGQTTGQAAAGSVPCLSEYVGYPGLGGHQIIWLESGGTTTTFYGDLGVPASYSSGIYGTLDM